MIDHMDDNEHRRMRVAKIYSAVNRSKFKLIMKYDVEVRGESGSAIDANEYLFVGKSNPWTTKM